MCAGVKIATVGRLLDDAAGFLLQLLGSLE
jgi:hypothetical protein